MTTVEQMIIRQMELKTSIENAPSNLAKKGKANYTSTMLHTRIDNLDKSWIEFHDNHLRMISLQTDETAKLDYFAQGMYAETEEIYLDGKTQMLAILDSLLEAGTATSASTSTAAQQQTVTIKTMPNIVMPRFSGDYLDWHEFRDLFLSKVGSNTSYTNADRMYYLKTSLDGDAAKLLSNYGVTGDSFSRAWSLLKETYESLRIQVEFLFQNFNATKPASSESASEIRRILSATTTFNEGMQRLKRPTVSDDVLVYNTAIRLDKATRRAWEVSRGSSNDPATFDELKAFLKGRICMLAAMSIPEPTKEYHEHKQSRKEFTPSSHHAAVPTYACQLCNKQHFLWRCDVFRAKSTAARWDFVRSKNLCENCLGTHSKEDCRSPRTCFICENKHHTILHTENIESCTSAHVSAVNVPSGGVTLPSNKPLHVYLSDTTSFSPALLPTALVDMIAADGTKHRVRALIDQGSQCSFVSSNLIDRLQLPRNPAFVPITGIGGMHPTTTQGRSSFRIASRYNPNHTHTVDALILSCVTSYSPSAQRFDQSWKHLHDLSFADDYDDEVIRPIELLLGSAVYAQILLEGVCRSNDSNSPIAQRTTLGWIVSGPVGPSFFDKAASKNIVSCHSYFDTSSHQFTFNYSTPLQVVDAGSMFAPFRLAAKL